MGQNFTRNTVALVVVETTPGTENVPDKTKDALLLFGDGNVLAPDTSIIEKTPLRGSFTQQKAFVGRSKYTFNPATVLMPQGSPTGNTRTTGPEPFFDSLFRMCGQQKTTGDDTSESSSTRYVPRSSSFESGTAYVYADGLLHKSVGVVGTYTVAFAAGQAPDVTFSMEGSYADPTTVALPTGVVYPADNTDIVESLSLALGGWTSNVTRSVNFDAGVQIAERLDVNSAKGYKGSLITGRAPTLECVVEYEDTLANKNFWNEIQARTTSNVTFTLGDGTTSKIDFAASEAQPVSLTAGDDSGMRTMTVQFRVQHSTDEGEYSWEFGEKAI